MQLAYNPRGIAALTILHNVFGVSVFERDRTIPTGYVLGRIRAETVKTSDGYVVAPGEIAPASF